MVRLRLLPSCPKRLRLITNRYKGVSLCLVCVSLWLTALLRQWWPHKLASGLCSVRLCNLLRKARTAISRVASPLPVLCSLSLARCSVPTLCSISIWLWIWFCLLSIIVCRMLMRCGAGRLTNMLARLWLESTARSSVGYGVRIEVIVTLVRLCCRTFS